MICRNIVFSSVFTASTATILLLAQMPAAGQQAAPAATASSAKAAGGKAWRARHHGSLRFPDRNPR